MHRQLLLVIAAAALAVSAIADEATTDSLQQGKTLFNTVGCWECHGFNGQGANARGVASGPRIDAAVFPREAFFTQLRTPMSDMPPYSVTVLSDAEVDAIYAYLKSLPPPRPRANIPLLR